MHNDEERKRAILTRRAVLQNIGDLARAPAPSTGYHHLKDGCPPVRTRRRAAVGHPEGDHRPTEAAQAGGVHNVLFAAPGAAIAGLRTFAEEVMPAFESSPMVLAV